MSSNKKLVPKTGKLVNPPVPVAATNPDTADSTYEADARGSADQDGNQEHARRKDAVGTRRVSPDKRHHALRRVKR